MDDGWQEGSHFCMDLFFPVTFVMLGSVILRVILEMDDADVFFEDKA